jgi:hypothetical protein
MNTDNKRTTKEYPLPKKDGINIRTKYGTLDKNNPNIIYIRSKAVITPITDKKDFSEEIIKIKRSFENKVKETVRNSYSFEDKHICTIEMSENGISFGKKSHVKYDIYVKPKEMKPLIEYHNDMLRLSYLFNKELSQSLINNNIKIE